VNQPTRATRRGETGFVHPGSPEHGRYVTASKVASILGVSRFQSAWSLWQHMRGNVPPKPDAPTPEVFLVGHAYELALAELWRLKNPAWRLSPGEVQYVTDLGFPAMATVDRRASKGRARKIVEMKTARDLSEFGDPEKTGEVPADYAAQLTFQMMVSGVHDAELIVIGPFFQSIIYRIDFDEKVANWINQECRYFYDSLKRDTPPPLDDSVSTYYTAKAMHPDITLDLERVLPEQLAVDLQQAVAASKEAEAHARGLKSKVLDLMGDAQHGTANGERVVTRRPGARGSVNLIVR